MRTNILKLQKHFAVDAEAQHQPFYTAEFGLVLKPIETAIAPDIKGDRENW